MLRATATRPRHWITVYASAGHAFIGIAPMCSTPPTRQTRQPSRPGATTLATRHDPSRPTRRRQHMTERQPLGLETTPHRRGLKRSLLAATLVLAIASTITQPVATRPDKHVSAAARTHPATISPQPDTLVASRPIRRTRSRPVARLRPLPRGSTPRAAAARPHTASPRDRAPERSTARTPQRHPGAAHEPQVTGTPRLRVRDHRRTRLPDHHRQLLLTTSGSQSVVAELVPPDLDTLITPDPPALPATGPARGPPRCARLHPRLPRLHLRPRHRQPTARPHPSAASRAHRRPTPSTSRHPARHHPIATLALTPTSRTLAGEHERRQRTKHLPGKQPPRPSRRPLARHRPATRR